MSTTRSLVVEYERARHAHGTECGPDCPEDCDFSPENVWRNFPGVGKHGVCAECREPLTSMRGVQTAKDGAKFHGRCWSNA